jgi:hypothetical protein
MDGFEEAPPSLPLLDRQRRKQLVGGVIAVAGQNAPLIW